MRTGEGNGGEESRGEEKGGGEKGREERRREEKRRDKCRGDGSGKHHQESYSASPARKPLLPILIATQLLNAIIKSQWLDLHSKFFHEGHKSLFSSILNVLGQILTLRCL